jgi:hypothetical protein
MQESHLVQWVRGIPFEPFVLFVSDGRTIEVKSPETVMLAEYALGLYVFHNGGHVEVIDGSHIVSMRTLTSVDPTPYLK